MAARPASSTVVVEGQMQRGRSQDRFYPVVLIGFLIALVATGLLGVPALLVAALGAALAAIAILALRGLIEADARPAEKPAARPRRPARQYVPTVLEGSSMRRRRGLQIRRRHQPQKPLRYR